MLYAVGRIRRSFGVKGFVAVEPLTHTIERFEKLAAVYVGIDGQNVSRYSVEKVEITHKGVILKLREVGDKTKSDALAGHFLFIEEQDLLGVSGGSYFVHDITGCDVYVDGKRMGTVVDVYEKSQGLSQDIWVVQSVAEAGKPAKQYWVPALREVIESINVQERTVVVRSIEDFLQE